METVKLVALFFVFLIILSLVLFVMGKISAMVFWIVVILCALVAYKGLPWLRVKFT